MTTLSFEELLDISDSFKKYYNELDEMKDAYMAEYIRNLLFSDVRIIIHELLLIDTILTSYSPNESSNYNPALISDVFKDEDKKEITERINNGLDKIAHFMHEIWSNKLKVNPQYTSLLVYVYFQYAELCEAFNIGR